MRRQKLLRMVIYIGRPAPRLFLLSNFFRYDNALTYFSANFVPAFEKVGCCHSAFFKSYWTKIPVLFPHAFIDFIIGKNGSFGLRMGETELM